MKFKKKLWISLILFILFGTVFSGWIFHQNTTREYLVFDNTTQLVTTERFEDNIRIEDVILPDSFQNQQSILFRTTHTRAEVLLDGEKIYEFGNDTDTLRFMKSPGPCWHIVDLPKNSDGKHLQVRIIPVYSDYYGNSFHLFGGTKGDCTLKILSNSLCSLVLSCEILSLGIICLILCFSIMRKNDKYSSDESYMIFLNLGVFSLLITLWTLKQCGFLQFLIPDSRALYFIDYFTFFLFPVPFNFILYDICKSKYRKGAVHLSILYLCNMAAAVLLQCAGIIDIFRILPITHLIMLVNVIYTVTLIRYESIKLQNEAARHFKYPMYLVMALGAAELIAYYIQHFQQTSIFLPFGTMLFSINPIGTAFVCIVPRILEGLLCGLIFQALKKSMKNGAYLVASLSCPLLNTLFFMTSLVVVFYNTDYIQGFVSALGVSNPFTFVVAFVGVQGLIEAVVCFVLAGAISRTLGAALHRA